jgi:hypothetical protein
VIKKILLSLALVIFLLMLGCVVWINMPCPEAKVESFVPQDSFMLVSLDLKGRDGEAFVDFLYNFHKNLNWKENVKWFLITKTSRLLLPVRVIVASKLVEGSEKPVYFFLVKSRHISQLARLSLFFQPKKENSKKSSFRVVNDVVIISKKLREEGGLSISGLNRLAFIEGQGQAVFLIDNSRLEFSRMMKAIARKSYPVFPSVDSVKKIQGFIRSVDARLCSGEMFFYPAPKAELSRIEGDIDFFSIFIKRFFKARGFVVKLKEEISQEKLGVKFSAYPE